ncbi:HdeD family acid-resistance protein [Nocardiopsis alba]|uniref:HdeD family acid-resistance protein n=1 Tax=Nocardiopsis alba TaxID=53437 RepID=UPI0033B1B673
MVRNALAGDMLGELSRHWWVLVVRGGAAVIFGLLALIWPGMTLLALAIVFGVYALVDGVALGVFAYRAEPGTRTPLIVQSVIGILLGLGALFWPVVAILALVFLIGAWAIITGIAEMVTAVRLRSRIDSEWMLIFVGALSVIFGLMLWFWPLAGAQAVVLVVAVYAIVFGVVMAVAGFRLKGSADTLAEDDGGAMTADTDERTTAEAEGASEEEREVSPFDEGYADGYRAGYEGDRNAPRENAEENETVDPRAGRHRAPKKRPDDPGSL